MIFPKRKPIKEEAPERRVRLFSGGGGLGLQYVQQKPDMPDIEGVQLMMQNQAAIDAGLAKAKAELTPEEAEIAEQLKGLDLPSGMVNDLMNQWRGKYNSWAGKYGSGYDIFKKESKHAIGEINKIFSVDALQQMKNAKELFKEQAKQMDKSGVGSNTWLKDNTIMVEDPTSAHGVSQLSLDQYYDPETRLYEKYRPLTQQEVSSWQQTKMPFNSQIKADVGFGMKFEDVVDNVYKAFNGLGYNETGKDGFFTSNLSQEAQSLTGKKLNADIPLLKQLSTTIKDNDRQLQAAIQVAQKGLSQEAREAIMQELIKQGKNPHGIVTYTDSKGRTREMTELGKFLGEMITGEASKNRIYSFDEDVSLNTSALGGNKKPEGPPKQDFVYATINNPMLADGGNGTYVPVMPGAFRTNVKVDGKTIPAAAIRIRNDERKKEFIGDTPTKQVRNQKLFIDGKPILFGTGEAGESTDESLVTMQRVFWTNELNEVVGIPPNTVTGQTDETKRLRRSILVHEDDAPQLATKLGMTLDEMEEKGLARRIDQDADPNFASLTTLGFSPEWAARVYQENERHWANVTSGDRDMIVIDVEEEIDNASQMQRVSNIERVEGKMNRHEAKIDAIGKINTDQTNEIDSLYNQP